MAGINPPAILYSIVRRSCLRRSASAESDGKFSLCSISVTQPGFLHGSVIFAGSRPLSHLRTTAVSVILSTSSSSSRGGPDPISWMLKVPLVGHSRWLKLCHS
ncbi:hypothetical protein V1264_024424 [Littorina saxatilis]|uniref:Uncharacterized protein n=1 Tax=Littorina saxatilis TaxID=31220 RepID=A0AAN9AMG1_9CAEN